MSLLGNIGRGLSRIAGSATRLSQSPIGQAAIPFLPGGAQIALGALAASQFAPRTAARPQQLRGLPVPIPGAGFPRLPPPPARGGGGGGGSAPRLPKLDFLDDFFGGDSTATKKRRRMNPCNERALKRALRRIEAYDRTRKRVDKALRKVAPRPQRRSPRTGAHAH